jgi:hypothetical protein
MTSPATPTAATITTTHKRLALNRPDTAPIIEVSAHTLSEFNSQHSHTFKLHCRRLPRRQFDIPKIESFLPSGPPVDPEASLSSAIGEVSELVSRLSIAAVEGIEEVFEKINEGLEAGIDQDFNIDSNLERKDRYMPLEAIQNLSFKPKATLIDSYASGSLNVGVVIKFRPLNFDAFSGIKGESAGDRFGGSIGGFLQEVSLYVKAAQEIKPGLQAEIVTKQGIEWFCA